MFHIGRWNMLIPVQRPCEWPALVLLKLKWQRVFLHHVPSTVSDFPKISLASLYSLLYGRVEGSKVSGPDYGFVGTVWMWSSLDVAPLNPPHYMISDSNGLYNGLCRSLNLLCLATLYKIVLNSHLVFIQGLVVMSSELEDVFGSMMVGRVSFKLSL